MHQKNLSALKNTAALIAAAAVFELYPDVEPLEGGGTDVGFSYFFSFPHPFHLHVIEERMRKIVKEKKEIRVLEMAAFSAKELFKAKGFSRKAEKIEENTLVELVQIGDFYDLKGRALCKTTAELVAFRLGGELKEGILHLFGWCQASKEELKEFLRLYKDYEEPFSLGKKRGLWEENFYLPKGILWKKQLVRFWRSALFQGSFEIEPFGNRGGDFLHEEVGEEKVSEVGKDAQGKTFLRVTVFSSDKSEQNSYLQRIGKALTMLGFDHSVISSDGKKAFSVKDRLGREHTLALLENLLSKKGFYVLVIVEEVLMQMVEKNLTMVVLENE